MSIADSGGLRFWKGHGTENDFVLLPDPDGAIELTPGLVRSLCDRRAGVGADGVLRIVRSAKHPEAAEHAADAEWFMDFHNADGTAGEMCGNGLRVFARWLLTHGEAGPGEFTVATRAGLRRVLPAGDQITIDAQRPTIGAATTAWVGDTSYDGFAVDVGNPHLVCAVASPEQVAGLELFRAPRIDPEVLPAGANVEFVAFDQPAVDGADEHVVMRVHERGVGETRSCGTGACAVAAVALRRAGRENGVVAVDVPGGRLVVSLDGPAALLSGPAVLVASGELTR
ncbi:diaminopimelate epimerase [Fodinicola feengrottensis]|uniref:Diaminopimelate epimerase n=1 Tax=Fodinicola feengrottensis TaxID=435914 RepID=A0ABN2IU00_9ACTN